MQIFTMGFTKKTARDFFGLIRDNGIDILVDVRLNNQSQLAGFTKGKDLEYFLKEICECRYYHETQFAPSKTILDNYKKKSISWSEYEQMYNNLITQRHVLDIFRNKYLKYERVLFLCSEATPENCHRRLLAEYLQNEIGCSIKHI